LVLLLRKWGRIALTAKAVLGLVARGTDEQLLRELTSGCYDNELLVAIEIYHSNCGDGLR
jgi:hypothetical protein